MKTLLADLTFAWRVLRKSPGFTIVALLALALGIGVNTAIFSTVSSLLLRPSAYHAPDELVIAFTGNQTSPRVYNDFSYPNYLDFREQNRSFSGLIAYRMTQVALSSSEQRGNQERAEIIWGETVSGNYFDVLGVPPARGRGFLPEEDRTPNTHPVVVLSHDLWQRRYSGEASLIGKSVYLNGHPFTVIGIAPESLVGTKFTLKMDFWTPLMMRSQLVNDDGWRMDRGHGFLTLTGRLKPGVTLAQAQADFNSINETLVKAWPKINEGTKVQLVAEREGRFSDAFPVVSLSGTLAMFVVGLVLLIACANVANLMLARAVLRSREIGIRLAIGAGRWRIVRQLLTESVLLALLGGLLGLSLAFWSAELMRASIPPMPYRINMDFEPDWRVFGWALGISMLTGIIFGLAPALYAARTDLVAVLKSDSSVVGKTSRRLSLRSLLVIAQIAVSIIVLVCAGLFLRSLRNVQTIDPGFNSDNLVSMQLDPELLGYKETDGKRFYHELVQRVRALPGVASATVSQVVPLSDNNYSTGPLIREGDAPPAPNQGLFVSYSSIGTRYFETMETPLLLGRDFTEQDRDGAPQVVIINQELARRLYGDERRALGQRFYLGDIARPPFEIVGIARDGKYRNLFEDPRPYMFLPHQQRYYWSWNVLLVRARSATDVAAITEGMRNTVQSLDARLPVFDIKAADQHLSYAWWGPRLGASMAMIFGVLALALSTMGLYSVMTYAVSQRTREIGIRMALGAQPHDVLRPIVRQGMLLVIVGLIIGLGAAFALSRVLSSLLLNVSATDPLTFTVIALLLAGVALLACYLPAHRATRVDPMIALRCE